MKKYLLVLGIAGLVTISAFAIRANDLQKTVPVEKDGTVVVIEEVVKTPEGVVVEEAVAPVESAAPAIAPVEEKKTEVAPVPAAEKEVVKSEEEAEEAAEEAEEAAEEAEEAKEDAEKVCVKGICPLESYGSAQEKCCWEHFLKHVRECAQKHACPNAKDKVTPTVELGLKMVEIDGKPMMILTVLRGLEHHFLLPLPEMEHVEKEELSKEKKEK